MRTYVPCCAQITHRFLSEEIHAHATHPCTSHSRAFLAHTYNIHTTLLCPDHSPQPWIHLEDDGMVSRRRSVGTWRVATLTAVLIVRAAWAQQVRDVSQKKYDRRSRTRFRLPATSKPSTKRETQDEHHTRTYVILATYISVTL